MHMWHVQSHNSLSLLDLPVSAPLAPSTGNEQPWSKLIDWSVPSEAAEPSSTQV